MTKETFQAYKLLHLGFTALPIVAGLDKFFHILTDWNQYLAPIFPQLLGMDANLLMQIGGGVEILAGIFVFFQPKWGGYLVAVWMWSIIANLMLVPGFYDIAFRDFGLSLGALALARLATSFEKKGE